MLEKLWGLPAHPVYVHFPVTFLTFSTLLLGLHRLDGPSHRINRFLKKIKFGSYDFEAISFFLLLFGFGGGIVAVLSGLALVGGWPHAPFPHALLGVSTLICYFTALVLRWTYGPAIHAKPLRLLYYLLHLVGFILILLTGYEGGELHYS